MTSRAKWLLTVGGLLVLPGMSFDAGSSRRIAASAAREHREAHRDPPEETAVSPDNGIVTVPSHRSVDQTVDRLESMLRAKGVTLFALIDHSGEAKNAGLHMPPTKLLMFGNPKAGTPLMLASPTIAIDLPLKLLVWEDAGGKVWISYNAPAYLQARHGLPPELAPTLAVVEALAAKAGE
jgi:uncharacterized protein (DUF302 family)